MKTERKADSKLRGRRECSEIMCAILETGFKPSRKSHLITKVGLSSAMFERYMSTLLKNDLIVRTDTSKGVFYQTTTKGLELMSICKECGKLCAELRKGKRK